MVVAITYILIQKVLFTVRKNMYNYKYYSSRLMYTYRTKLFEK